MADKSMPKTIGDYNTDVLWKPPRISARTRTISTDSTGSDADMASLQTGRRFSLSEYFSTGGFQRKSSVDSATGDIPVKKHSITENADFKDFLRRQKRILEE